MADKKGSASRQSEPHSQREDNERNTEQNTRNELPSRDTSDQTVESQDDNPNCPDTQLSTGTSLNVVDSKGPVQLGTGSSNTVINNPTYYNYNNQQQNQHHHHHHHHHYHPPQYVTNEADYLRWVEQRAAALGSSPTHSALPSCPVSQRLVGVQLQDHREEDTTDISGQSQTHRKTALSSNVHDNSASFHLPCHCQDCLEYHHRDHPPLPELSSPESESQHSGLSHHPVPQQTKHRQCTKNPETVAGSETLTTATRTQNQTKIAKSPPKTPSQNTCQLPSEVRDLNPGQLEKTSDNRHQLLKREAVGQRSSLPPRPSPSDVTSSVTSAEQAGKGVKTVKATHCENLSHSTPTVPRPDKTRPVYSEGITDSVCIIDSKGRSLEPGDAVWFERDGGKRQGIYVGHQQVVWVDWRSRDRLVSKEELKLAQPFGKYRVVSEGELRPFPRGEVIRRVESRVGTEYTEGDSEFGFDFPEWAMTGMGWSQAWDRGFGLD